LWIFLSGDLVFDGAGEKDEEEEKEEEEEEEMEDTKVVCSQEKQMKL
jgi:hypothetical protein